MDFVTITDENSVEGCLAIAELPGTFMSVKLAAFFEHVPQAVQILCFGITEEDHEWLVGHRESVHAVAGYLRERKIPAALAHPFEPVTLPLTHEQRDTLRTLFGLVAAGSGDRTGEAIGTTWTTTPYVSTPEELLDHLRAGRATPHGIDRTAPAPAKLRAPAYELRRRVRSEALTVATVVTGGITDPAVSRTLDELKVRGVPGYAISFTDNLTRADGDLIHLCGSGMATEQAVGLAGPAGIPLVSSFGAGVHRDSRLVLSPSRAADARLVGLGVDPGRIRRWELGVNPERFSPAHYHPEAMPAGALDAAGQINVLCSGPLDHEHDIGLLTDAFEVARERDRRLHLVLVGTGRDEAALRSRLGSTATFLGELSAEALARAYASADLMVCPQADGYGQPILDAQASGLPVLAVGDGAAVELIQSGRNGCLAPSSAPALAEALLSLARRATLRERLATGGLLVSRERTWERSLRQLAAAWSDALSGDHVLKVAQAA